MRHAFLICFDQLRSQHPFRIYDSGYFPASRHAAYLNTTLICDQIWSSQSFHTFQSSQHLGISTFQASFSFTVRKPAPQHATLHDFEPLLANSEEGGHQLHYLTTSRLISTKQGDRLPSNSINQTQPNRSFPRPKTISAPPRTHAPAVPSRRSLQVAPRASVYNFACNFA